MSNNSNLFYKLYSNSNNVTMSGYVCLNAVDEEDTSFDITASSSGSAGVITDSNGNTLASIDLSQIHAAGITQYNTETKILLPYSCCLLQGQEYGLACASYYFIIPKVMLGLHNYELYVSCDFDVIYNNFTPYKFHIHTEIDGLTSFVDLINDLLNENNIELTVSLLMLEDPICGHSFEYLVFTSSKEGYFYYINNIKLEPAFLSEEYPESPFSRAIEDLKETVYSFIELYMPLKSCMLCADCSCGCKDNDKDNYEVDCDLYRWIINNYQALVDNLKNFKDALVILDTIEELPIEEVDEALERVNALLKDTPYDDNLLNDYDLDNMHIIYNVIESFKSFMVETADYYLNIYWLVEDRCRRIPLMKYPNGAFRGIILIPDWPTNNSDKYTYRSLWVNHIKSQVKLYRPTKEHQFLPKVYGVLSNATIMAEEKNYRQVCPLYRGNIQSNCSMCNHIADGWNDNLSTDYMDPYRPEHSIYEDTMYMGLNCYAHKKNVIGLFRYMLYVNENKLWNKVGLAYMIIGNPDDPQSHDKNLPLSLVIYNPNPEPIRLKYIIFS